MAWAQRFFDDFDNATVDVQQDAQNGTITEPAGTELVLSGSAGTTCRWDDAGRDRPCAYEEILTHDPKGYGFYKFEAKVSGLTKTGVEVLAGLCLWGPTSKHAYLTGWYDSNDDVYLQRLLEGTEWGTRWNGGNYGNPETTPHIYQLFVNLTARRQYIEDIGVYLDPNEIGFRFSANNGSSYVWAYKEGLAFIPTRFGVYARNWSTGSYRGFDAAFDYLEFSEWDDVVLKVDEPTGEGIETHPQPKASIEEGATRLGQSGPVDFSQQIEGVQRLPGPVAQQPGSVGPFDTAGIEDRSIPGLPQSGEDHHGQPEWGDGRKPHVHQAGLEVPVFGGVVDADYLPEKDDADGAEFLDGLHVLGMARIDTTVGGFGDPTANNHWGVARDGKIYADGVECGPGVFGTLASGVDHEHWCFSLIDPFGKSAVGSIPSMVADDQIRFVVSGYSGGWANGAKASSELKWFLQGDFDIQVDFSGLSVTGTGYNLCLYCVANNSGGEGTNRVRVAYDGTNYYHARTNNGAYVNKGSTSVPGNTSGKLRITRTGSTWQGYYWTGSAWATVGSAFSDSNVGSGDVFIDINLDVNNANGQVDYSSFIITSGTTTNRAGWYRESSGDHRGTQADMPNVLGVVTTDASLDLIDLTNDKLWMRFQQGTNNVLGATAANTRPRRVAWDDGQLFVAYGSHSAEGGAAIAIDFTHDVVRWHREQAASETGGVYRGTFGRAAGVIALRNSATAGYSGDDDAWRIPDYRVYDVALYRDSGEEFRAIATLEGLAMFKWTRWYTASPGFEYSLSNETTHMRWCFIDPSTGELFYMDTTKMYSEPRTTGWEAAMTGGTFTANSNKDLPGTRKFEPQWTAVKYGSYLFVPAAEGVYRVDWPSGSWTLFYGKAGSGATHEILNDYDLVHTITLGNDGTLDLLAIATARRYAGQVTLVRLDTNVVYGLSKVEDLKICNSVAA
jgi:hypothetical protein